MKYFAAAGVAVVLATAAVPCVGDTPPPAQRVYTTQRIEGAAPKLDGVLDDACWQRVEWATDFVQFEPAEGQPPTEQTAFKILYDDHALYLAYRAYEKDPHAIANLLARRDRFPGDWVEINIDSYFDHRTAYSFTSSVSGARGDEFVSKDGDNWDGNWDPIWELRTHVDEQGWTAEVRIPFTQLRFASESEQTWGIQVTRRIFRKEERSLWQPMTKSASGWVSRFGELRGISGVRPQRQVELLPYTVGRRESFERVAGNPFLDGRDADASFGLDGKIGVSSDATLDLTVNPDFGQVEADPSEVNLTAFETRFDEKRPFFIEGNDILDFQLAPSIAGGGFTADNLFYSRRIGRQPRFSPDLATGENADVPNASSILGAAKLTGKSNHGLSLGVLESVTAEEHARVSGPTGGRKETVEPYTNFFVGRLSQDFDGGNRRAGVMFTALQRKIEDPQLDFLHRSAYAGGVDVLHQWHDKAWYVAGTGAFSNVNGDRQALLLTQQSSARYYQRPDNNHESLDSTRTSLTGHAGSLRLGKGGGKHWHFESGAAWRSPGFEINDVGFLRRSDEVNQFSWVGYSIRNPVGIFRRVGINGNQWVNWDFGGQRLSESYNTNFNANFKNNWQCGAGLTRTSENISNNALRGGPSSRWPGDWSSEVWVNSDHRRRVGIDFGGNFDDGDDASSRYRNGWVSVSYRPSNAVQISINPDVTHFNDQLQYVDRVGSPVGDRYVLAALDQKTTSLTFRLDYTVRPNLTLQYYGSPFVSAGSYTQFKRVTAPRAARYADRFHTFAGNEIAAAGSSYAVDEDANGSTDYAFDNPNFNVRDFNSNLVLRWEFQAGSTAFLVWSQARSDFEPTGTFSLHNDVHGLFDVHPHDVFLLKISKWFSL